MSDISTEDVLRRDEDTLHKFGYKQELARRMSGFGNFAMSFMVIGLFWALTENMQQGIGTAGLFGTSVVWIAGCVIAYATATSLGEIASSIPTAGGLYHWATVLGGRGWGWATACINLLAYVFSVGGTAVACYLLFNQMILGRIFHIDTSSWGYWQQAAGVTFLMVIWGILNHIGVKTLSRIGEIGAYVTFVGAAALVGIMLYNIHPANLAHIATFVNYTGDAGGGTVPHTDNVILVVGYALLLPMWIVTSYDAAAHVSEETVDASRSVPRAMKHSVLLSAIMGFVLLTLFGLAMADPAAIAKQGSNGFLALFDQVKAPEALKSFVVFSVFVCIFINGACNVTGFSRAVYAFARDGGLPRYFGEVSHRYRTPARAIWLCSIAGVAATLYSSAFNALVAGTALFYQLCYGMAILAAMFSKHRTYGPYRLGIWSKPFNAIGVVGGIFIIWVGLQPPTEILVSYFVGIFVIMLVVWFGIERRRFQGPPTAALESFRVRQKDANATIMDGERV